MYTWSKIANEITQAFDSHNVKYVLIKAYDVPYVRMTDVDLLVEDDKDIDAALSILEENNFCLQRDRYSLNHKKMTAVHTRTGLQIDIYPEATWFNMRFAKKFFITSRRVKKQINGFEAYVPDATMDLYIVATHSYNHGFITLAEAAHSVKLISTNHVDWELLIKTAKEYRLCHALYPYLKIAQLSISDPQKLIQVNRALEALKDDFLVKKYASWFKTAVNGKFPYYVPLPLKLFSGFARLFRKSLNLKASVYDELLGYALAFLFRFNRKVGVTSKA